MNKIYFQCGLSNGETITEHKGAYTITDGKPSPWQRLLSYIEKNNLTITSLSLASGDGKRWNLPSAGKNPKFKAFDDAQKPESYNFFRKMGGDVKSDGSVVNQDLYHVIEAIYRTGNDFVNGDPMYTRLQTWVDEATGNSWSMIV